MSLKENCFWPGVFSHEYEIGKEFEKIYLKQICICLYGIMKKHFHSKVNRYFEGNISVD